MKKKLAIAAILLCWPGAACEAAIYWAAPGLAHETFTALIADIEEQDGDILYIQRGVAYTETFNLYVNWDIRPFGTGAMPVIDATGLDYGAIIWGAKTCKITGIEVKGSNSSLLGIQSGQLAIWQADGVYLHDNVANPCLVASGDGGYLKNSILSGCANTGLYGVNASNWLVENNQILNPVTNDNIALNHDGAGSGNIVRGNLLTGAPENAVDTNTTTTGIIVEENEMSGAQQYVVLSRGTGETYQKNYMHDCARGMYFAAPVNVNHNYCYNLDDPTYGSLGGSGGAYFLAAALGSAVINNTFITGTNSTDTRPVLYFETGAQNGTEVKNNVIRVLHNTAGMAFQTEITGLLSDYNDLTSTYRIATVGATVYASFADWQAIGQDANSYNVDPYLSATGKPTARSPYAVKRGGDLQDGYPSIAGRWAYLGAYPYYEGTITPWNIALSIMGGPGRLGGGTIYHAPAEEYLGNYFLDGTTVFLDGSTYFVDGGL